MWRHRHLTLWFAALVGLLSVGAAPVGATAPPAAVSGQDAGRVLVTFKRRVDAHAIRTSHSRAGARARHSIRALRTDVVDVADVDAAIAAYRARSDVEWAGRDTVLRAADHVVDNRFSQQWNLQDVAAQPASLNWHSVYAPTLGEGVTVAVLDTGVGRSDPTRPAFDGFLKPFAPGYDFVPRERGTAPDDEDGHGTHIAGTIAQRTGNAVSAEPNSGFASVAGVAPSARIMPVRVLGADGSGLSSETVEGILFAADKGANVINLSLSGDYTKPLCDAVKYATARGVLVVAASGNESESGLRPLGFPAACQGAIGVGGHTFDANRGLYSNGSCELAFTAPGADLGMDRGGRVGNPLVDVRNGILQETVDGSPDGYGFYFDSGTSMAAAHVSGAAAVLMGAPFNKSASEAALLLRATARDRGLAGQDDEFGSGMVDLAAAVAAATSGSVPSTPDAIGYWMVASDGGIFSFGKAPFLGSTGDIRLNSPIVGMARTSTGKGYWLAAADGGIFTFGDARFFGSAGSIALRQPIVGMSPTPTGQGYWLVAADGGIFAYGDAQYHGSTGGRVLNNPVIGMATTRSGKGYWLVGKDGGIFAFGDALFFGSTGNLRLNAPIVGITRTPSGGGYWMVATDGGIFAFGDAPFHGSTGNIRLNKPIIGMVSTCYGRGYWLVASDGGVFAFGGAPFLGSTGNLALNRPIVGGLLAIDHRSAQL